MVLDAAGSLAALHGPSALTFALVGTSVGLSPASLVQRFGTRDELVRAALLHMWDKLDQATAAADARSPSGPEGALELLVRLSVGYGPGDDEVAQGLLLLREDLRDPLLRARGVAWGDTLAAALGRRLCSKPTRQKLLGRLLVQQWQGAVLWWCFSRSGRLGTYLRRELRVLLGALADAPRDAPRKMARRP